MSETDSTLGIINSMNEIGPLGKTAISIFCSIIFMIVLLNILDKTSKGSFKDSKYFWIPVFFLSCLIFYTDIGRVIGIIITVLASIILVIVATVAYMTGKAKYKTGNEVIMLFFLLGFNNRGNH